MTTSVRSTYPRSIGTEFSLLLSSIGSKVLLPILMYGATSWFYFPETEHSVLLDCHREVKFGALMKELTTEDTWIATGTVVSVFARVGT